jgi:DNA-binding MarR family transcriptional regulator
MENSLQNIDSVDLIAKQWESVDKDVMHESNWIFLRLYKLSREIETFHCKVVKEFGITFADYDLLITLFKKGEPYTLSPTQLFKELLVTSGTMTYQVDKLVSKKLIKRLKNPSDRRSVVIHLTSQGLEKIKSMYKELPKSRKKFLKDMSLNDQKTLNGFLRDILLKFERNEELLSD